MTAPQPQPASQPFVVQADRLHADAVLDACVAATTDVAVLDVTGPGAVQCVQGLVTNDVEQPGDGALIYGAFLTNKGMIVADAWIARSGGAVTLAVAPD